MLLRRLAEDDQPATASSSSTLVGETPSDGSVAIQVRALDQVVVGVGSSSVPSGFGVGVGSSFVNTASLAFDT